MHQNRVARQRVSDLSSGLWDFYFSSSLTRFVLTCLSTYSTFDPGDSFDACGSAPRANAVSEILVLKYLIRVAEPFESDSPSMAFPYMHMQQPQGNFVPVHHKGELLCPNLCVFQFPDRK